MKIYAKTVFVAAMTAFLFQGCATTKPVGSPEMMFKDGEQYFQKGNYEDAITQWKRVKESYQSPELTARAEINIADAYFLNKDYIEAAAAYEDFRKLHPKHERADYALYRQAMSHYKQFNSIDTDQTPVKNALVTFQSYLSLYPGGGHTAEVTDKIRDCRDKLFQYEIYVGRFYLKTGKFNSAIGRFESALKAFPELPRCDEALYYLAKSYEEAEQQSRAREAFERLVKEFPGSRFAADAARAIRK